MFVFQKVLSEISDFINHPTEAAQKVIQKYVDVHKYLYMSLCAVFIITPALFILSPLIKHTTFPVDIWYPISTDSVKPIIVIYLSQSIGAYQTGFACYVDVLIVILFWHTTVKFELLGQELEAVENIGHLQDCIKKHQRLIL